MVQLSLMEEIKDKASRLIPTAYMEIVEECTAPHLLIPTYEHVKFLCETVNKKPDAITDVVRALRRRVADNDVAVKHLTIQLLESMIKNTSTQFHIEVASQKGLLRDLVAVACMQPTTGRAMQAKEAALQLVLNLSIWFRGHPAEQCYILTTLADDVRNQLGPNCFEGIEPERNTRVRVQISAPITGARPPAAAAGAGGYRANPRATNPRDFAAGGGARQPGHRHERRNIVDAIPIDLPTPERVSAMLDVCVTFSEYLNNAAMNTDTPIAEDDVVQGYQSQVKADHDYVTVLLSSNLQLDRDVLRTVSDSEMAVLTKVEQVAKQAPAARRATATVAPAAAAIEPAAVRSATDTEETLTKPHTPVNPVLASASTASQPPRATPPRAEVASGSGASPAAKPAAAAPTVEDLFADAQSAPAPGVAATSPPSAAVSSSTSVAAPEAPAVAAPAPAVAEEEETQEEEHGVAPQEEHATTAVPAAAAGRASETFSTATPASPPVSMVGTVEDAVAPSPDATAEPEDKPEEKVEEKPEDKPEEKVEEKPEDKPEEKVEEKPEDKPEEKVEEKPEEAEAPAEESAASTATPGAAAAPSPTKVAPPKDDDDFDAFLEGRMGN